MASHKKEFVELTELVDKLNKDRAWILEQLDRGNWPEFRPDLAALERELGQLLTRATEYIEENCCLFRMECHLYQELMVSDPI